MKTFLIQTKAGMIKLEDAYFNGKKGPSAN